MNDSIIRTQGLTKTYGQGASLTQALRGVDLEIERGGLTCIVGPSGHGKSTLMHLLGGLDRPSSGRVQLDGQNMFDLRDSELAALRSRKIGFVFQFFNLLQSLTARENVEMALMLAAASETRQKERAEELLELVGLSDKINAKPGQLSGGQQQRVAIARALANDPPVLLMDEPTGNLDSAAEAEVLNVLEDLVRQGKTIILVTHSAEIAARADTLVRVRDGVICHD
ncbi:ABC transporter ATP-binding protein [Desulfomicrobium baculatum]|uniref:ABC transporter related n=1 Tax=Desulfomicrobium baculatum (strain DSM 4028 / VKM B-1378 / X) TaxID=525897 RepID=C7LXB3_DESBD|nr:ABC transporter ATP-binding protein [Desulfomicrobium baculatum]ACU89984.1 ABC transporter related [Desulfomicrobium baculatum DSM 4028]